MRLIDADKLIADLEYDIAIDEDILNYVGTVGAERTNTQFDKDCKQNAIDLLMTAPTIEARPKGEWIWNENGMDWGLGCWCCSECGMRNPYIGSGDNALLSNPHNWAGSKYCPNCGADMRKESE